MCSILLLVKSVQFTGQIIETVSHPRGECKIYNGIHKLFDFLRVFRKRRSRKFLTTKKFKFAKAVSEKESVRLVIICSRCWSMVVCSPISALGLHMAPNEFTVVAKYSLGVHL